MNLSELCSFRVLKPACGLLCLAALLAPLSRVSCGEKPAAGVKTLRVLFVGNSLTAVNDLPAAIAELAKSRGSALEYVTRAPNGYSLADHFAGKRLGEKLARGNWEFVVLQEQSRSPAYPRAETEVFPYVRKLSAAVRKTNPGAKIAFYMTMARKNGETQRLKDFPALGTYGGLQQKLNEAYVRMASENNGVLVPVGPAWELVRARAPSIELYSDQIHPSKAGTYLAACVFYAVLFGDTPVGLPHPPELSAEHALILQKAAADAAGTGTQNALGQHRGLAHPPPSPLTQGSVVGRFCYPGPRAGTAVCGQS